MKRNLLLVLAILISVFLTSSSIKKIISLHGTSQEVAEEETQLEALRKENEALKRELQYKKSERFIEEEIRNKLGLAKEGEEVFVVPSGEAQEEDNVQKKESPNWKKWKKLFLKEA